MKSHVWRPLYVVLAIVVLILLFRAFYVPEDFGIQERGYTFGFYRLSNEQEWKDFPAKYRGSSYCQGCHYDKAEIFAASQHAMMQCENCHGAAFDHPENPEKLNIDRSRDQCLRCHSQLYTPSSDRSDIAGVNPLEHNAGIECSVCHNPHHPSLEEM